MAGCDREKQKGEVKEKVCFGALWSWQTDKLTGRVVVAALLVGGKREKENICSDIVISLDCGSCKEYFYSPRNQNEGSFRRHKCLCIKNLLLPCRSHPSLFFLLRGVR